MQSLILSVAARSLLPLLLLFSFFLLVRGHNEPGGGFVGGLVAAAAVALYAFAVGVEKVRQTLRVDPRVLIVSCLFVALSSGLLSLLQGKPFMTGLWYKQAVPVLGKLGTPVLFDAGVYLVVVGIILTIILTLAEE